MSGKKIGTAFVNISNGNGLSVSVSSIDETTINSTSHTLGFNAANAVVRDGAGGTAITVDFSFSAAGGVDLTELWVWNYTQANCCDGRGVNDYEVYLDSGSGFSATPDVTGTLAQGNEVAGSHFAEKISLGTLETGVVAVRLVGLNNNGGNAIGLDEVAFAVDDTVVPEPSSALLGLIGALGLIRRRRS